jgi:hypothetical protein
LLIKVEAHIQKWVVIDALQVHNSKAHWGGAHTCGSPQCAHTCDPPQYTLELCTYSTLVVIIIFSLKNIFIIYINYVSCFIFEKWNEGIFGLWKQLMG